MNLRDTYNKIANEWHRDHQNDDWWITGTNTFVSMLKPGALVLDVGCAAGTKSKHLISKGLKVVGIDIAEKFIEIAKREVPGAEFLVLGMEEIKTLNRQFDGIFMQASLLHIPRLEAPEVIKQAATRLNDDGLLYIAVKAKKENGPEEEVKTEHDYGYAYTRFFSYFTTDEIKSMIEQAGLKIAYENVTPSGKTHWVQVIGKK